MTERSTLDGKIAFAFRNVDTKDIEWLTAQLGDGGHGRFWKSVLREISSAMHRDGEHLSKDKP